MRRKRFFFHVLQHLVVVRVNSFEWKLFDLKQTLTIHQFQSDLQSSSKPWGYSEKMIWIDGSFPSSMRSWKKIDEHRKERESYRSFLRTKTSFTNRIDQRVFPYLFHVLSFAHSSTYDVKTLISHQLDMHSDRNECFVLFHRHIGKRLASINRERTDRSETT